MTRSIGLTDAANTRTRTWLPFGWTKLTSSNVSSSRPAYGLYWMRSILCLHLDTGQIEFAARTRLVVVSVLLPVCGIMLSGSYGVKDVDPLKYAITNPGVQRLVKPIAGHDCETYETPIEAIARRSIEAAGGRSKERSKPSRHIAKEIAYDRLCNGISLLREQSMASGFDNRGCHPVAKFGLETLTCPTDDGGRIWWCVEVLVAHENQRRAPGSAESVRCIQIGHLASSRRIDVRIHGKDRLGEPFETIGASLRLQSVSESGSAPPPITLTAELGSQEIRLRSAYRA